MKKKNDKLGRLQRQCLLVMFRDDKLYRPCELFWNSAWCSNAITSLKGLQARGLVMCVVTDEIGQGGWPIRKYKITAKGKERIKKPYVDRSPHRFHVVGPEFKDLFDFMEGLSD